MWLKENIGSVLVLLVVLLFVGFIVFKMRSDKKKGKGHCAGCSGAGAKSCPYCAERENAQKTVDKQN